ncbi:MAG: sodium:alanine symporter family protein [Candidatus Latescibacter sp.]|nr:sodium:alanine symporter family protein [Candidatus Latescibacter sp.]
MESVNTFLVNFSNFLWGFPLIVPLIGTGLYLTLRLGFVQFIHLPRALKMIFFPPKDEKGQGEISHFQALMTALAATVGTGNIAGVATAIAMGGPGAMFWMWVTGLLGMASKYSEAVLALHYRDVHADGTVAGGPMYYIAKGVKSKMLAVAFAVFTAIAAFGIGNMVQSNSTAEAINGAFGVPNWITGIVITILAAMVLIGGIKSIGRVTQVFVPVMIIFFMTGGFIAVIMNLSLLPFAVKTIFVHAFTGEAVWGGVAGHGVREAMRYGLARGLFSNESGLGSAPIAAAAARTDHPVTQALISMTQTFIDTLVVCSMTGVIIVMADVADGSLTGAKLSAASFNHLFGSNIGGVVSAVSLALFAYSTVLGWCYYGEKAIEYLFGSAHMKTYRTVYVGFVFIGSVVKLESVWCFADIMNGFMALPNLFALVFLAGTIKALQKDYFDRFLPETERAVKKAEL